MHMSQNPSFEREEKPFVIGFSRQDSERVLMHENNPMVIKVQIHDWNVKKVLIDPGISVDILYWDAFKGINMDTSELLPFKGTLVGFSGEQVQVLEHLPLMTIFGSGSNAKGIRVRYLIVNASSPYNIIIGRPNFNASEEVLSIVY